MSLCARSCRPLGLVLTPLATSQGFLLFSVAVNFLGTRVYGEVEHAMGWLKVLLVIGLIFACLIIDLGGNPQDDRIGASLSVQGSASEPSF